VRTTIDLPEDLYRALKARAALTGVTLRELVRRLIEQGLGRPVGEKRPADHRDPPPVIIPPRGKPIPAVPRARLLASSVRSRSTARRRGARWLRG